MTFQSVIGIICVLIACSNFDKTKSTLLVFENTPTRGMSYTDSTGIEYGLIYISSSITNIGTKPISIQIDIPYGYNYPDDYGAHNFKILLWPGLDTDQVTDLDSMSRLMDNFRNKPMDSPHLLNKTLDPGEKYHTTIGTLFERGKVECSVVPYTLFNMIDVEKYSDCKQTVTKEMSTNSLGLRLGYCTVGGNYESCEILDSGMFSISN